MATLGRCGAIRVDDRTAAAFAPSEVDKNPSRGGTARHRQAAHPEADPDNPCQLTDSEFGIVQASSGDGANMIAAVIHDLSW